MTIREHRFEDAARMTAALRSSIIDDLETALEQRPRATLLVSGGSTPSDLYRSLSEAALDWQRIDIALVDERWVDPRHAASNEHMVRETLLAGAAAKARFTGMKNDHPSPTAGEAQCNRAYESLQRPFDAVVLGMGLDGHFASLFPGAEGFEDALGTHSHCAAIHARRSEVTGENLERMTLTPWSLSQSRHLYLLIRGEDKWRVYDSARQNGANHDCPISLLLATEGITLEIYWSP